MTDHILRTAVRCAGVSTLCAVISFTAFKDILTPNLCMCTKVWKGKQSDHLARSYRSFTLLFHMNVVGRTCRCIQLRIYYKYTHPPNRCACSLLPYDRNGHIYYSCLSVSHYKLHRRYRWYFRRDSVQVGTYPVLVCVYICILVCSSGAQKSRSGSAPNEGHTHIYVYIFIYTHIVYACVYINLYIHTL